MTTSDSAITCLSCGRGWPHSEALFLLTVKRPPCPFCGFVDWDVTAAPDNATPSEGAISPDIGSSQAGGDGLG